MRHKLFKVAVVLSLVLCIATAILWALSYTLLQPELSRCGWNKRAVVVHAGRVQFYWLSRFQIAIMGRTQAGVPITGFGPQMAYTTQGMAHISDRPGWNFMCREEFGFPPGDNRAVFVERPLGNLQSGDAPRPGMVGGGGFEVSLWPLLFLTSVLPTMWLIQRRRAAMRAASGHCRRCGYDLRATPDRCPECGAVPEARPATAA